MTATATPEPQKYALAPLAGYDAQDPAEISQKHSHEKNYRLIETSILQIIDRLGGLTSRGGGNGGGTIIITGSDSSFFRLNNLTILTATVSTEQPIFTTQGVGSRQISPTWWQLGRRLVFAIPIQYALESGTTLTVALKAGTTVLHSMVRIQQQDKDLLLVVLDIKGVSGNVMTLAKNAFWASNFDADYPDFSDVSLDTGGAVVEIQVSVTFSVADSVSQVKFQNVDFSGMKAPVAI